MTTIQVQTNPADTGQSALTLSTWMALIVAIAVGALGALVLLPMFSDIFAQSLVGKEAKGYWFLSRASGVMAYVLFWASMMMGLLMSTKTTRLWSTGPTFMAMHEFTSILGLLFAGFHALILLGDAFIQTDVVQILTPFLMDFGKDGAQSIWVGFGQLGFYALALILLSFYVRQRISYGVWRWLHFGTFVAYMLVTVHGMLVGSDSQTTFMLSVYAFTNASILFLTLYRVLLMKASA
jgi:predicted ferric reductase